MRHRRLITLLLVLALPLPGLAALGRAQAPCPMQADARSVDAADLPAAHHGHHGQSHTDRDPGAADSSTGAEPANPDAHCCDDGAFALLSGACKPGQHCQSVSLTLSLPSVIGLRANPTGGGPFGLPDRGSPPKASPAPIWRPPAA